MDDLIEIKNKTEKFIAALRQTESFQLYYQEKEKLDENPSLKEKIAKLRKIQTSIAWKKDQGEFIEEDLKNQVMELYADISISKTGFYYLLREKQLIQLIYQIFDQLEAGLELDFGGLEE